MQLQKLYFGIFEYIWELKESNFATVSYDELRSEIKSRIDSLRNQVSSNEKDDFELALFAVVAWIDEIVQRSGWEGTKQWQDRLLQAEYFETTDAGDEFYNYLAKIPTNKKDLIRIFYRCMLMEFKGEHNKPSDISNLFQFKHYALDALSKESSMRDNLGELVNYPKAYPEPRQHATQSSSSLFSRRTLWWLLPVPVLLGLYFFYYFVIHKTVTNYLHMIQ